MRGQDGLGIVTQTHHAFLHTSTHSRPAQDGGDSVLGSKTGRSEKAPPPPAQGLEFILNDPMPALPQRHASPNLTSVSLQDKGNRTCIWMPESPALTA